MKNNKSNIPTFAVDLVLGGITLGSDPDALRKISDEFSVRPHVKHARASWLDEEKALVSIHGEIEGLDEESSGKGMAEEVFEIAYASLREVDGVYVEIVGVNRVGSPA